MTRPSLVVLAGATAVGKTGLAVKLCGELNAEVVSADSVQIYRGLDIGSAKPTPEELALAPHHLIDAAEADEEFDAGHYVKLADQAIDDLNARGKRVIVAGGAGLYIRALLHGLAPSPPVDEGLRRRLLKQWEELGAETMHQRLSQVDPQAAMRLHPNDRQRVLRALEVFEQTSRPFSELQARHRFREARYPCLLIGLERSREELNQRIELRCRMMMAGGLESEVRGLLESGVPADARSMQTLGYLQMAKMLRGELSREEAFTEMISKTRAYAKRQLTWFRGMEGINWINADDHDAVLTMARIFWSDADA